ncbi:MAG TPA: hypothetical protein VGM81_20985 [Burkholderiaceae bacterium]|jgi:hypothetical protein
MKINKRLAIFGTCLAIALAGGLCLYSSTINSASVLPRSAERQPPRSVETVTLGAPENPPKLNNNTTGRFESAYHDGDIRNMATLSPKQLFDIYKRGIITTNIEEKYLAQQAVSYCMPAIINRDMGAPSATNLRMMIAVRQSRNDLAERCRFFSAADRNEILESKKQLDGAVLSADSPMNPNSFELGRNQTDEVDVESARQAIRRLIDHYGADALLWVGPGLQTIIERTAAKNGNEVDPLLHNGNLSEAMPIAMCRLGFPCGKDSIIYMTLCIQALQCGDSIDAQILANITDENERRQVQEQAVVISESILKKQYGRLGL